MARANNNGWDFVKAGESYQYKEDCFIAMVTVLEDNSDDEYYRFKLQVEKSSDPPPQNGVFEIINTKTDTGYYSGMLQLYERPEYHCDYKWIKTPTIKLNKQTCEVCGQTYLGDDPKMCCNGRDCGCLGLPIEPMVCSKECYDELINKNENIR